LNKFDLIKFKYLVNTEKITKQKKELKETYNSERIKYYDGSNKSLEKR
jgi:hypothetical protein